VIAVFVVTQSAIVRVLDLADCKHPEATRKGYDVHLIDRCPVWAGRGRFFEKMDFAMTSGPTVLTAPSFI